MNTDFPVNYNPAAHAAAGDVSAAFASLRAWLIDRARAA